MFVRKNSAKLGVAGLAASAVAFAVLGPAGAATPPALNTTLNGGAPVTSTPVANSAPGTGTIVFAGSDTIQYVVADLADAWNSSANATTAINGKKYNILSYNALANDGGAVTSIGSAWNGIDGTANSITTPNGSGPGLQLLGATDANGGSVISYARSSSAPDTSKTLLNKGSSDAIGYPFALDTVVLAVSAKNTAAPASLTDAQVLSIYNGTDRNWAQVGGKSAKLDPLQPKSGSGTAKFFASSVGSILAANGGDPTSISNGSQVLNIPDSYTPAGSSSAVPVPEHSGAPLAADTNAIVPISLGRALLWNKTNPTQQIRIIGNFKEQRALWLFARASATTADSNGQHAYNADTLAGGAVTNAVLGSSGFFCSPAAQQIVMADGFFPLSAAYCGKSSGTINGDIVPANNGDHIAPASMFIDNPLLKISTGTTTPTGGGTTTTTHPTTPVKTAAQKKLAKDKAALAKAKKQLKKAHGHKKTVLKKKIAKLNKAIKKDKKNVKAGK